jgi:hypothetical protein
MPPRRRWYASRASPTTRFYLRPYRLGQNAPYTGDRQPLSDGAPERKVYYVTSERFSMDYVSALQAGKVQSFKEKYRQYDLLIMDDVQFLAGRDKIKEEFFHLFNYLHDGNKQLGVFLDQHPTSSKTSRTGSNRALARAW